MDNMNEASPVQPMGAPATNPSLPAAGIMLKQAWALFRSRIESLLIISLIAMLIIFVLGLIFGGSAFVGMHTNVPRTFYGAGAGIIALISMIILIFEQGALIAAVDSQQPLGYQAAYKTAATHFWTLLLAGILTGIVVGIGFVLIIIPGIIFAIWLSMTSFVVMLENKGIIDSMKQSKAYVTGRWSAVFWRLLALIGVMIVISIPISILSAIIPPVGEVVNLAYTIVATPFALCYTYILYKALRGETVAIPTPVAASPMQ